MCALSQEFVCPTAAVPLGLPLDSPSGLGVKMANADRQALKGHTQRVFPASTTPKVSGPTQRRQHGPQQAL